MICFCIHESIEIYELLFFCRGPSYYLWIVSHWFEVGDEIPPAKTTSSKRNNRAKNTAPAKKKQEATPAKWIDTSQLSPTCLEALDEGPELGRCNWVEFR